MLFTLIACFVCIMQLFFLIDVIKYSVMYNPPAPRPQAVCAVHWNWNGWRWCESEHKNVKSKGAWVIHRVVV